MKYVSILLISALLITTNSCDEDDDNGTSDDLRLDLVAEGFSSPVILVEPPGDDDRLFVVDQSGQIYIIKEGVKLSQPFLDVESEILLEDAPDERGLLGLAFHPNYTSNGKFYIYYAGPLRGGAPSGWDHTNFVAEYKVSSGNADVADDASGRVVLAM